MPDVFIEGGPFMLPLTILGALIILVSVKKTVDLFVNGGGSAKGHKGAVNLIFQMGLFSVILGVLSQAMGLYQALGAIVAAGDVSPALIFGGLRVSFIAPIYGMMILLVSVAAWSILKYRVAGLED